jgi:hypothetical protein
VEKIRAIVLMENVFVRMATQDLHVHISLVPILAQIMVNALKASVNVNLDIKDLTVLFKYVLTIVQIEVYALVLLIIDVPVIMVTSVLTVLWLNVKMIVLVMENVDK